LMELAHCVQVPHVPRGGYTDVSYMNRGRVCVVFQEGECRVYYFCRQCSRNFSTHAKACRCEQQHKRTLRRGLRRALALGGLVPAR